MVLRDFVRLVFPADAAKILGSDRTGIESALRKRWLEYEDVQNKNVQQAAIVARQNGSETSNFLIM